MKIKILKTGLISVLLVILIQIFGVFYDFSGIKEVYLRISLNSLNAVLNILILIILWYILAKFYKQTQLDYILKSIIVLTTISSLFSSKIVVDLGMIGMSLLTILSIINVILYFVLISRVMKIDQDEISQIEHLKNYGLAFVISLFGQFILSLMTVFIIQNNLKFINHFLVIAPLIFIGLFFFKLRNEIRQK